MSGRRPALSIPISLQEIYDALCPACRDVLLSTMAEKVGARRVRYALQEQLERGSSPPPSAMTDDDD